MALDFAAEEGRAALRQIIEAADVVVEASRPRALEQLGVFVDGVLAGATETGTGPRVWLSITGYGRAAPGRTGRPSATTRRWPAASSRWTRPGPCFLADAVADPCAGLVGAAAVLQALAAGGRWLLDVSMRDVAAHLAGPLAGAIQPPTGLPADPPRARAPAGRGPRLGEHTEAILDELRPRRR